MATKHDSSRAQANLWVAHQNMARAKGARPFQPKAQKPMIARKPVIVKATVDAPALDTEAQPADAQARDTKES
jgi:hypothetical protein